ncbi:hypothetical protein V8G54_012449 [Vigna mungo]|uniref:Uncharacterized protein n=1 Tax=Vigna mungo TaxID=3915 RepID=A0AAQ3S3D5_VIGMU
MTNRILSRLLGYGNHSSYDLEMYKDGILRRFVPCSRLMYHVDGMTCVVSIFRPWDEMFVMDVKDSYTVKSKEDSEAFSRHPRPLITFSVEKDNETGLLFVTPGYGDVIKQVNFPNFRESLSGVIETVIWRYSSASRKGLFVLQEKKKSKEEKAYMGILAHYFGGSGANLGFSVVVKIGVVNGQIDYSVDGPVQHPSSSLLYMIDEVCRTGTWKPSACPHCKNIQSQQRRLLLSESEDSDTNLPTPPPKPSHGNTGRFNGDGIGNIIHAKQVRFIKQWIY